MGIANSGTTMMGRWEDGLLDLEVVVEMGVGMMHQHLEIIDSFCEGGVGACIPLEVAAVSVGPFISITPTIGMVGWRRYRGGGQWVERHCLRLVGVLPGVVWKVWTAYSSTVCQAVLLLVIPREPPLFPAWHQHAGALL